MAETRFPTIAVATDGSVPANEALDVAIDLAKRYGSSLTVLAVAPLQPTFLAGSEAYVPPTPPVIDLPYYRRQVDGALAKARAAGIAEVKGLVMEGVPIDEILVYLKKHPPSLVVVGSRGLSRGKRLLLGSVSTAVVQGFKGAVLVVHPRATKPSP
ncbi:MAG: universal stress protein [Candidatus Thermoplasmatota archaeon]|nr:universal stress protein [Candidatus Thermoplasmatota archaeon]